MAAKRKEMWLVLLLLGGFGAALALRDDDKPSGRPGGPGSGDGEGSGNGGSGDGQSPLQPRWSANPGDARAFNNLLDDLK